MWPEYVRKRARTNEGDTKMKNIWKAVLACGAVATLGAAGCERRGAENDRIENRPEGIEDTVDRTGEKLEQAGKDMFGGESFEVAKINMDLRTVELRRTSKLPGVNDKKDLQSGKDSLTLTFDELAMHVEGDKSGKEIAEDLHVGENVRVFYDDSNMVKKITY